MASSSPKDGSSVSLLSRPDYKSQVNAILSEYVAVSFRKPGIFAHL